MFVKFPRALVLGIVWIMLSSYTEASPMPAPVASYRPTKHSTLPPLLTPLPPSLPRSDITILIVSTLFGMLIMAAFVSANPLAYPAPDLDRVITAFAPRTGRSLAPTSPALKRSQVLLSHEIFTNEICSHQRPWMNRVLTTTLVSREPGEP
ncbi:hypothetical protein DFH08DRAFT_944377 [Mycena albidolilacea]|uniref:Uncharacterized protein n=1 Tax=Mycena albidolilacea TaxID=1033008 RepID=A0AAD6Z627_9AGAR|nr:hypothetical protein DFH08DRAFT_944377 [Mycena albidolilacea]